MYAAGVLGGLLLNAPTPLFFQLALEVSYPEVHEAAAASTIALLSNGVSIVFLVVTSFAGSIGSSSDGTAWMDWLMCFVTPAAVLPLVFTVIPYERLAADQLADETVADTGAPQAEAEQVK